MPDIRYLKLQNMKRTFNEINLEEIENHANRLLDAVKCVKDARVNLATIQNLEYYEVIGTQAEKENDVKKAISDIETCEETLAVELRIGGLI